MPGRSVLIACDTKVLGDGLGLLLQQHRACEIVGVVTSGTEAIRCIEVTLPDVVLLHQCLRGSLETMREIRRLHPPCCVVAVGLPDDDHVLLQWAEAGAAGLLAREASIEDLGNAIESAMRGELHCSPHVAGTLLRTVASRAAAERAAPTRLPITPREAEIVRLIDDGLSNKEIAHRLGIALATVKNHIHNLLEKLRVARRSEAAARLRAWKTGAPASRR